MITLGITIAIGTCGLVCQSIERHQLRRRYARLARRLRAAEARHSARPL
jgi:hypothetical protein